MEKQVHIGAYTKRADRKCRDASAEHSLAERAVGKKALLEILRKISPLEPACLSGGTTCRSGSELTCFAAGEGRRVEPVFGLTQSI